MKTPVVAGLITSLALVGCKADSGWSPLAQPGTQQVTLRPIYGWTKLHEETFELHPLQAKWFALPPSASRLRVSVQADSAIFGGAFDYDFLSTNRRRLRHADFQGRPCSLMYVDKSEVTCVIEDHERMGFLVRDERAEGTQLMAVLGARLRSGKMAERGVLPNRISIALSTWQCIENCKKS